jgi:hypothetical protein
MVHQPPKLMPKDMVYVMHECALAEVKATSGDNEVEVSLHGNRVVGCTRKVDVEDFLPV